MFEKEIILEFDLKREYGNFGFSIDGGESKPIGIYISNVEASSKAEIVGLKAFDFILSVNETDFTKLLIQEAIYFLKSSNRLKIRVKRFLITNCSVKKENNQSFEFISLTKPNKKSHFGFKLNFVMEESKKNKLFVIGVEKDFIALNSNLKIGDQILSINNFLVETLEDFYKVLQMFKNALTFQIVVIRHGKNKNSLENSRQQNFLEDSNIIKFPSTKRLKSDKFLSKNNDFFKFLKCNFHSLIIYDNLFFPEYN